jgi:hypothetical protein
LHFFDWLEIYAAAMRRVFLGTLSLVMLGGFAPTAFAAPADARRKTIKDLSSTIPLELFQRSVGPKFYRSLLASPLEDWSVVRAHVTGTRLARPRVIRPAANPVYNSLALKFATGMTLVANKRSKGVRQDDSALMHLLIYKIADGVMAVSFAYPEVPADQQMKDAGQIRLSVKTNEGPWTEITASETHERGRRLRRMDRMPMDAITIPGR